MFKQAIAAAALAVTGMAHAFVPQAGTWIISNELNGKPGRGFAIDFQNDIMVMQVYAYESNGQPTFYMSSGKIQDVKVDNITQAVVDAKLGRYEGGRFLGSGDRSGVEAGSPGNVRLRFVSGTKGYITLPGEQEKEIKRYQFGYDDSPASMLGMWTLLYATQNGQIEQDVADLTRTTNGSSYSNGMAVSYDGMYACEQLIRGSDAGKTQCIKYRSGSSSSTVRSFLMTWSVNTGEGDWRNTGSSGNGAVYANRLIQGNDRITSILRKFPADGAGEPVTNNDDALRAALEELAASR